MDSDNLETATYTLIYSFLSKRSHVKAAQAVKKAAKDLISLEDITLEDPQLDTIVDEWRKSHPKLDAAIKAPSLLNSESESSSSSNSSSSVSSPDCSFSKRKIVVKAKPSPSSDPSSSDSDSSGSNSIGNKKLLIANSYKLTLRSPDTLKKASPSSSDSSSSDSESSSSLSSSSSESEGSQSDDESSDAFSNKEKLVKTKIDRKGKLERDSSRTLTSGNDSDDLPVARETTKGEKEKERAMKEDKSKKQEMECDDSISSSNVNSDSDSTSSSSPESGDEASKTIQKTKDDKVTKKRKAQDDSSSDSSVSDSSSDEDSSAKAKLQPSLKRGAIKTSEVQVIKKLRTSEDGAAVSTAMTKENGATRPGGNGSAHNRKNGHKSNTPFQRFDPSKVPVHIVKDNRYEAKAGSSNDYGQRAHRDLIVTRGAGFRKEKNKKKRGSYKGGEITLESHSFKFT